MKIGSLIVEFLSDTSGFKKGNEEVNKGLDQTEKSVNKTAGATKAFSSDLLILATTATAAGYAVYATVEKYGALANELTDLSYTTGIATDELQRMQYAAILSGTEFSQVSNGINQLTLSMSGFKDESSAAHLAFVKLGIDPTGKPVDQVFNEIAESLLDVSNETDRNTIAAELLGRNWKTLLPYLQEYIDKRKELAEISVLTPEEIQANKEAKAEIDALIKRVETFIGKSVAYRDDAGSTVLERLLAGEGLKAFVPTPKGTGIKGGVDYSGKTLPMAKELEADPFAGLTAKSAEIEHLSKYVIPGLEKSLAELQKSGTAKEIADASLALIQARENLADLMSEKSDDEKERISAITDSYKDLESAIKGALNAEQSLSDLNAETAANLQDAGTDVAAIRSIMKGYASQRRSIDRESALASYNVESATGTFNQIAAGAELASVPGTSQYEEAQAQSAASAGGITINGNIYLNGDRSFENYLSQQRQAMGIRNV